MSDLDMSAFEAQFDPPEGRYSKAMPNDDFERLAFLTVRIDDIKGENELLDAENEHAQIARAVLNHKIAELRKQVDELVKQRQPIDASISRNVQLARENFRTQEQYERELARLREEFAARQRIVLQRKLLDQETADYPWRVGNAEGKKALRHQLEGAHRLVGAKRGILGDKPGLGKTLQAIMTIDLLRAQGNGKKVIIFTPKSVLKDFERSFQRWTHPKFVHILNQTAKGTKIKSEILGALKHWPEFIILTNYEVWWRDPSIHKALIDCGADTIFMDEAHILKDPKSSTSQKVRELVFAENLCPQCGGQNFTERGFSKMCLACKFEQKEFGDFCSVKNVYPMTGTPILNKPQELWPLLNMVDREGFPSEKNFLDDYCTKKFDEANQRYYYTFGFGGSERLLSRLGTKFTARDRDSAGVEMPPQEIKHHWLDLDPEKYPKQHQFVADLRDKARIAFTATEQMSTDAVLAWYTRMRQAASWPDGIQIKGCACDPHCEDEYGLPDVGSCKNQVVVFPPEGTPPIGESVMMDEAETIVSEAVEDGDRIVVFSMFRSVINELERRCEEKGLRYAKIVGGVSDKKRQEAIDDFNTQHTNVGEHKFDVLICQYQTSQVGLNLNGAQQLLMIEREWNPGKEQQTIDRVRRIDSKFDSIVHVLHCPGTATDLIDAIQEQKKKMLDGFEDDVNLAEEMRKFLEG